MPTPHNEAQIGEIAKTVIMPGDPLRAKYIAEHFLTDYKIVNYVRGMFTYTGKYKGKDVTIMASGMGIPSMGIYSFELFNFYNVENIIRIGTCGALDRDIKILDLLLVDDVQFIANKPKTHELFFTIFNELVNNKKQICITSDRTPSEIKGLEDRIISRFNQGLNVNIEAPEYETSINILKMKIANSSIPNQVSVDDEVLNYLATNFSQDVRSLEGAVNRLLFYSINFPIDDERDHISLKLAIEAFKDQIKEGKNELAISTVRKAVCDYYNLTKQQITSANRTKNISNARQIAMYLCRKLLDSTYDDIGREFGGRDHSTVMSSCENVERKIKTDPLYLKAINEIESKIK